MKNNTVKNAPTLTLDDARSKIQLNPFYSKEHYDWYESLIDQEPHADTDFYTALELKTLIESDKVCAWIACSDNIPVGWCAVQYHSAHHPIQEAVHFLGVIVEKSCRGQGFGLAMLATRLALFEHHPITASILPGNHPSERMYELAGFNPGLMQGPWRTWHLPSVTYPMVLVKTQVEVDAFTSRGVYAEVFRPPIESGGGCILRGLWPDPAAFHAVSK